MLFPLYLQFGKYKPDWGDVPTWAAAFFALAAGIVAFFIYRVESGRDEQAAKERRARDEAERQGQAAKVAAWFSEDRLPGVVLKSGAQAFVKNSSDLPVYDVEVHFYFLHEEQPGALVTPIRRGQGADAVRVVPPGERIYVPLPHGLALDAGTSSVKHWAVGIAFRDAAGVRWERDPYGKLTELPSV